MEQARIRFENKINKTDTCWLWIGELTYGYGVFWFEKKTYRSHRFMLLLNGEIIPKNYVIRHKCRNRNCVNPNHLEIGTQSENIKDMIRDGTQAKGEKHGQSKLTETQIREIRLKFNNTQRELAKEYGVSQAQIHRIKSNKSWN